VTDLASVVADVRRDNIRRRLRRAGWLSDGQIPRRLRQHPPEVALGNIVSVGMLGCAAFVMFAIFTVIGVNAWTALVAPYVVFVPVIAYRAMMKR
jgi:hypothetical protein